jgi:hypothetical protein
LDIFMPNDIDLFKGSVGTAFKVGTGTVPGATAADFWRWSLSLS